MSTMSNPATQQQPEPRPGGESVTDWLLSFMGSLPACKDRLADDLKARRELGRERYGVELQAHNGRPALVDAYQEALDLMQYLAQAKMERGEWWGGVLMLNQAITLAFTIKQELDFEERSMP